MTNLNQFINKARNKCGKKTETKKWKDKATCATPSTYFKLV